MCYGVSRRRHRDISVAAPRLPLYFLIRILGLTPQAMYLSPLRGSRSHDDFSSGLDRLDTGYRVLAIDSSTSSLSTLRRVPRAARRPPRRLRRPHLHRPALQLQPQLRGLLGRDTREARLRRPPRLHPGLPRFHAAPMRPAPPSPQAHRLILLPLRLARLALRQGHARPDLRGELLSQ